MVDTRCSRLFGGSSGYRKPPSIRLVAPVFPFSGVTTSPDDKEFKWLDLSEILVTHAKYKDEAPKQAVADDSKLLRIKEAAWIPYEAVELKLSLLTIAHAGSSGHHGVDPTLHALRKESYWADQREDVRNFVSAYLLCMLAKKVATRFDHGSWHEAQPGEAI